MKTRTFFQSIKWITQVSKRFSRVDRNGRSAVTSILATLGICFGVMTLIVVISVMNGFQMSFIDSILEISSYHVRAADLDEAQEIQLHNFCQENKNVKSVTPFFEAQALVTGNKGGANSVLIRAVDKFIYYEDKDFAKQAKMLSGKFNFNSPDSIILGSSLARTLGVKVGDTINLMVMSGGSDVELFSSERIFSVKGIFVSGYQEINSSYAFVSIEAAKKYFGESCKKNWGIKLYSYEKDVKVSTQLEKYLNLEGKGKIFSWRDYNKSFFGTLRIEKNMLFLLVALIFVVVAINIYNGMRRLVFERKSEIAIFSALGARNWEIKSIFVMRGFRTGLLGALTGLCLGIIISLNTDVVFNAAAKIMYFFQYVFTFITNRENLMYIQENSTYSVYASIPARIFPRELVFITIFGILSPLLASLAASKNVLKMTISEVLHNE